MNDDPGKFAESGWLIEVKLTIDEGPGFRFFAVGTASPQDAEEELLRFPGVFRDDARKVRRQLSGAEIARLKLRAHGVRPYRAEGQTSDRIPQAARIDGKRVR